MTTAAPATPLRARIRAAAGASLVAAVGLATVAAGVWTGGDPALTLTPIVVATIAVVLVKVPLRWPATALVFLLLSLEVTGDAAGIWSTPLIHLGDLLSDISGTLTGVKVAGFEVIVICLLVIAARRRATGSRLDGPAVGMPGLIRDALVLCLAGFAYAAAISLASGRGLPFWKVRYILHVPFLYLFFHTAYPEPLDMRPLGAVVVAAAEVKAILAIWVQNVAALELTGGPLAYATNHGDSILFAMAILVLLIAVAEGSGRSPVLRAVLLIPLPLWGLVLNRRRIGWAMLEVGVLMILLVSAWRPWKRKLVTALLVGAPIVAIYLVVGWNSSGTGIFGPVHKVRTMLDSSVDSSTYWREVEAWNVAMSVRQSPLVGLGLGGEYTEFMKNDDISQGYPEYRQWPHNTVLGQLLLEGAFGFAAIWFTNLVTMFLAARAYRMTSVPDERVAALACVCAVVCCSFMAWGDTGAHFMQYKLAAALSLTLAGKLALSTAAWPGRVPVELVGRPAPSGAA